MVTNLPPGDEDERGFKTGVQKSRWAVHADGDWHRVAHIWLINSRGEILLQRRTLTKRTHPGMLDVSCAGICWRMIRLKVVLYEN